MREITVLELAFVEPLLVVVVIIAQEGKNVEITLKFFKLLIRGFRRPVLFGELIEHKSVGFILLLSCLANGITFVRESFLGL